MSAFRLQKNKRSPFRWRKWALRVLLLAFLANAIFIVGTWFFVTDYTVTPIEQQIGLELPAGEWQAFSFKLHHKNMSYFKVVTPETIEITEFINRLCVSHRSKQPLDKYDMGASDETLMLLTPFWWQPYNAIDYTAGRCKAVSGVSVKYLIDNTQSSLVTLYLETGADSYFILPPQPNPATTYLLR